MESPEIIPQHLEISTQSTTANLEKELALKTHELAVEKSLKRIWQRAMAMQSSGEFTQLIQVLFDELKGIDTSLDHCFILLFDQQLKTITGWIAGRDGVALQEGYREPYSEHPPQKACWQAWDNREEKWQYLLEGREKKAWGDFLFYETELAGFPDAVKLYIQSAERLFWSGSFQNFGCLSTGSLQPLSDDSFTKLIRFAQVFDLTYTRFRDLRKAEAQRREGEIALALEKVRVSTISMQCSGDLHEVIKVMTEALLSLGLKFNVANFARINQEGSWDLWLFTPEQAYPAQIYVPYLDHRMFTNIIEVIENGTDFLADVYNKEEKNIFFRHFFENTVAKNVPEERKQYVYSTNGIARSIFLTKNIWLSISVYDTTPFTDEENAILKRFAAVFGQSYTRFLDLQKAEAQAREARIEAALEKVRSRSLAMQKSDEIEDVLHTVFERLKELDIDFYTAIIIIFIKDSKDIIWWLESNANRLYPRILIPYADNAYLKDVSEARENGLAFFSKSYSYDEKNSLFHHIFTNSDFRYVPEEQKKFLLKTEFATMSVTLAKNTGFHITSYSRKSFSEQDNEIFKRFAKVFEQAYTRFLDLQKAEAQARESQIQLALERVRARTMAMQRSEELSNVATVLFQQVKSLGVPQWTCGFCIWDIGDTDCMWYSGSPDGEILAPGRFPLTGHPVFRIMDESRKRGDELFILEKQGELQADHYRYMMTLPGIHELLQDRLDAGLTIPSFQIDHYANFAYGNLIFITYEHFPEMHDVFKRFAKVFEQTYTRFLDLQKAEAQAREAQIETSLERIRSKTIAMHNSNDIGETVSAMFAEFVHLGIITNRCGILIFNDEHSAEVWTARTTPEGKAKLIIGKLDLRMSQMLSSVGKAWKAKEAFYQYELAGEDLIRHYTATNHAKYYPIQFDLNSLPAKEYHTDFFFADGAVFSFTNEPVADEHAKIIKRFAAVFGQTFRRYLDLQKAEAQTREAQIEAALERVRARTMAMQKSSDLLDVSNVLREQLGSLGQPELESSIVHLYKDDSPTLEAWYAYRSPNDPSAAIITDVAFVQKNDSAWAREVMVNYQSDRMEYTIEASGEMLIEWYSVLEKVAPTTLDYDEKGHIIMPQILYYHFSKFSGGALLMISNKEPSKVACELQKRAAPVFELAYTRFLDLKKAEAQVREAQIEASLERVRSRTMAMHSSDDVSLATATMFAELEKLGIKNYRGGILNIRKNQTMEVWSINTSADGSFIRAVGLWDMRLHPWWQLLYEGWINNDTVLYYFLTGKEKVNYIRLLNARPDYLPQGIQSLPDCYIQAYYFNEGAVWNFSLEPHSEEQKQILKRFASVFSLTFRRYQDLRNAEAQAREAIKASSLDRIRAEIASMRTADDLSRITPSVWKELTTLGVPFFRCGVFIMNEKDKLVHVYLSTPDGKPLAVLHLPFHAAEFVSNAVTYWRLQQAISTHWDREQFIAWVNLLIGQGQIKTVHSYQGGDAPPESLTLQLVPFAQGMLYVGSAEALSQAQIDLVKALAEAFSVAYARYEDFKKLEEAKSKVESTLEELKATQAQLIQREKMASLGELTAGIAHEIQNPLNFINNFSDVNAELLDELKQHLDKNNNREACILAGEISTNEQKIHFHGRRADAIVKSMLQHSRSSSGKKEPVNLNALVDEYLRLSYHGFRAKEKTFSAHLETCFDPSITQISLSGQDIGRVLLNLFNNAFYSLAKKKATYDGDFEPVVTVRTMRKETSVEICVKDNGLGIPDQLLEKIYQPFFTTKPTGEGTGLGLSLSYDIITKIHSGKLEVTSTEGQGAAFMITLPLKD